MCCQKTAEKKGTMGGVTSCLGLLNEENEAVVVISRSVSGVPRFEGGGVAESCL